ncbi:hypothetical protein DMENIID0001_094540 [Sergentomyia squamirostris]
MKSVQLCVLVTVLLCVQATQAFVEVYNWKQVEYHNLPLKENTYIGKYSYYIPENNALMGLTHHSPSGLTIVTVPRVKPGIPSTLNAYCTSDYKFGSSPCPWGFPSYDRNTLKSHYYDSKNTKDDCIISVFSPYIHQECHRLYALDTGVLEYGPKGYYHVQNPAILVYQLSTDCCKTRKFPLVKRLEIPSSVYKNPAGFMHIFADPKAYGKCDDVIVYLPNAYDNCLVVCDLKSGKFWTVSDPSMAPVQAESKIVFNGDYYKFPLGLSISAKQGTSNSHVYYTPLASFGTYSVSKNQLWNPSSVYNSSSFNLLGYRGCHSQSFFQNINADTNVMFIQQMAANELRCWNLNHRLSSDTVGVVFRGDDEALVSDITIDSEGYIWFISGQFFSNYVSESPIDLYNVNTRMYRAKAKDVIHGTTCANYY